MIYVKFTSETGSPGKLIDSSKTRALLDWKPKYTSFRVFMRRLGGESVEDVESSYSLERAEEEKDAASALWLPGDDDDFGL